MTNTKIGANGTTFNPTVTAMFDAPKFANRAFNGEEGAAFLSMPLDDQALTVIKGVKAGEKLLLKKSTKPNKNGGATYYLEILPALGATVAKKSATEQLEDGI